jgi:hypothetical protein
VTATLPPPPAGHRRPGGMHLGRCRSATTTRSSSRRSRQPGIDARPHRFRHHFSHTRADRAGAKERPDRAEAFFGRVRLKLLFTHLATAEIASCRKGSAAAGELSGGQTRDVAGSQRSRLAVADLDRDACAGDLPGQVLGAD